MAETLSERAYKNIRRELISGGLKPGEQLVSRNLAERYGVSLAPVREAIGRLAAEGLIDHVPGSGSFVRTISKQDLYELFVLREALETCAAGEAAMNAHPAEIEELEYLCHKFDRLAAKVTDSPNQDLMDEWVDAEERFHGLLFEATKNSLLQRVANMYRSQIQVFEVQRTRPLILTPEIAESTVIGHREIAEAVRQRDAESARSRMSHHIRQGRQTIMSFFANQ
ncbi:MAG: GntR family transcriptional regulator [Planctomycetaceae bacterium]|nr:GntR family transcriptional regulator [Planctomycetaceae bacterium]